MKNVFYLMPLNLRSRSTLTEKKYRIYYYLAQQVLEKQLLLRHYVMKLGVIILLSMVQMNQVLMYFVTRLRTTLLQFLSQVVARLLSLMRPTTLTLIQHSQHCVEQLKNSPQTVHSFSLATLRIVSSIQYTLVVLWSILKSTVLKPRWLLNSLKELSGYLNKKTSPILKMSWQQLSQNTFQIIVEFSMNCNDTRFLAPLMLVSCLILLMYNLILLLVL